MGVPAKSDVPEADRLVERWMDLGSAAYKADKPLLADQWDALVGAYEALNDLYGFDNMDDAEYWLDNAACALEDYAHILEHGKDPHGGDGDDGGWAKKKERRAK